MSTPPLTLIKGLRPFSLCVALVNCGLAVTLAWGHPGFVMTNGVLLILGGLLLQSGVNLINDYSERNQYPSDSAAHRAIKRNGQLAWLCFLLAGLIALYFSFLAGWLFVLLVLIGAAGALGYTLEPINYKARGLAVPLVFWLMGVLMVMAGYLALTRELSWQVFWLSIPVSLLTSLLLLGNEIRDFEEDRQRRVRTLSVRVGLDQAKVYYWALLLLALLLPLAYSMLGWLALPALLVLPVLMVPLLAKHLGIEIADRQPLAKLTGRFYLLFGAVYLLMLIWARYL